MPHETGEMLLSPGGDPRCLVRERKQTRADTRSYCPDAVPDSRLPVYVVVVYIPFRSPKLCAPLFDGRSLLRGHHARSQQTCLEAAQSSCKPILPSMMTRGTATASHSPIRSSNGGLI